MSGSGSEYVSGSGSEYVSENIHYTRVYYTDMSTNPLSWNTYIIINTLCRSTYNH